MSVNLNGLIPGHRKRADLHGMHPSDSLVTGQISPVKRSPLGRLHGLGLFCSFNAKMQSSYDTELILQHYWNCIEDDGFVLSDVRPSYRIAGQKYASSLCTQVESRVASLELELLKP